MKNRHFSGSSRDIIEEEQSREYEAHVMGLRNSVTAIKEVSNAIKNQMVDDESLIAEVDRGFDKNKSLMKSTMGKIDKVLTSASGNTMCYVFLFAIIVVALLWKLTK
jgi:t-SNARE complex subunit (syntaxin)